MVKKIVTFTLIFLLVTFISTFSKNRDNLWPELKPYKTGYLKVSELHEIFYQLGGNPKGKPVMVIHGGPGTGCPPAYFRYFNPERFHIVMHDQRGAGLSKPYAEIKENTTQHLVEDIEKLRKHFNLGKILLFGGSWGTTLALAYGETYPENVSGMILRGVFTATENEIDHFYHGGTVRYFPENNKKLMDYVDNPEKKNIPEQLSKKLQNPNWPIQSKHSRAWAEYELKIAFLEISDKSIDQMLKGWNPYTFALLENYYMAHNCFLKEGQLLNNANKLVDIPMTIINGRYDLICPPVIAYELHKKLPKSKLIIVERAGHAASELPIQSELLKAVKEFELDSSQ